MESDWIVQLKPEKAIDPSFASIEPLFIGGKADFKLIRGLGSAGLVQVRGYSDSIEAARQSLALNVNVATYWENTRVSGAMIPNDSEFGSLVGLHNVGQFEAAPDADIDAVEAWDETTGNPSTVIAIVDSGIDAAHPDLYLNIWINQGEIPASLRTQIVDIDNDQLITFYDLNAPANAGRVRDHNGNRYVDAIDLLQDPLWADGIDTERNGFIDDFFGWNFRTGSSEPFPPNQPSDVLGHGTHVAGTIGAIGNNAQGVTGVNWRTSLMSLKFLDQNNQGDIASAIAAVNYATMMRTQYSTNVRVINSSWGQSGSPNGILGNAIQDAGEAGILVVAAAGNGNVLGIGVDNVRTPFYPASYELDNVIAVGASDNFDRLASFSNFGDSAVDVIAPGVGIRSTLPGGRYGDANGTSMAAPLVSGTAALVWTSLPNASVNEVRRAILESSDKQAELIGRITSQGRLNAFGALRSTVFAPVAELVAASNVSTSGGTTHELTVRYRDRQGINLASLGDDDIVIEHGWGEREVIDARLKPGSVTIEDNGRTVLASYFFTPPGGSWDALDFGDYKISTRAGAVLSQSQRTAIRGQSLGAFSVKVSEPSVLYVDTFSDSSAVGSLRSAIAIANAAPGQSFTIILESGRYTIDTPFQAQANVEFVSSEIQAACMPTAPTPGWSDASTGDFDIRGNLRIVGDSNTSTIIDGQGLERVFKVHPSGKLTLERMLITGGAVQPNRGAGGGILSAGMLTLNQVVVGQNTALSEVSMPSRGGGIAVWGGDLILLQSRVTGNTSDLGGGVFACGPATISVDKSTVDNNRGGGILSYASRNSTVMNSTISENQGVSIQSRSRDYPGGNNFSFSPSISRNGQLVTFLSGATNLVASDTNSATDAFVVDIANGSVERLSVSNTKQQANRASENVVISGDGSKTLFLSDANNLTPGDSLLSKDLFVRDIGSATTTIVNATEDSSREIRGVPAMNDAGNIIAYQQSVVDDPLNGWGVYIADTSNATRDRVSLSLNGNGISIGFLDTLALSGDGRYLTLGSQVSGTTDSNLHEIYLFDRITKTLSLPQFRTLGSQANGSNFDPALSYDGRFIAFSSDDTRLVPSDTNQQTDVFVFDRVTQNVRRVSLSAQGIQANGASFSPSISEDGRFIAFSSSASNLVDNDSNGMSDIFVADLTTGSVERISRNDGGEQANGNSYAPAISGNGRFVTFESEANNFDDTPLQHRLPVSSSNRQIYIFDRFTKTIKSVSAFAQSSSIDVVSSTIAFNSGSESIAGNVTSSNSLYAGNNVQFDLGVQTASKGYNILATSASSVTLNSSDRIQRTSASLLRLNPQHGSLPPGYQLLFGNPAIAGGSAQLVGTRDQWNVLRTAPDIGALAAVSGSASGVVFADLNANNLRDANEPGLSSLTVFTDSNGDGIQQAQELAVQSDTSASKLGAFQFDELLAGPQVLRTLVPSQWKATNSPIARVAIGSVQANGDSTQSTISASGRTIAFVSRASNLVASDNSQPNIFVYSRDQQQIQKIPMESSGLVPLQIMGDREQFVLFRSDVGVYLYNRENLTIEPISVSSTGELGNAHSDSATASRDGNWVVFSSFANNLVPNDNDNFADIFLLDRSNRTLISVTRDAIGVQGNNDSEHPSISADGRFITFVSDASNLVNEDRNAIVDVFVYDRVLRSIKRVNVSQSNVESNGFTYAPSLSADGQFVVFQSLASNLVAGDTNGTSDLFVIHLESGEVERLDIPFTATNQALIYSPSISHDGQYVVFNAQSSIFSTNESSTEQSVFVYDRTTESQRENWSRFATGNGKQITGGSCFQWI